jgi:hypothetical protein
LGPKDPVPEACLLFTVSLDKRAVETGGGAYGTVLYEPDALSPGERRTMAERIASMVRIFAAGASYGQVDPVFRNERSAASEPEHRTHFFRSMLKRDHIRCHFEDMPSGRCGLTSDFPKRPNCD